MVVDFHLIIFIVVVAIIVVVIINIIIIISIKSRQNWLVPSLSAKPLV